MKVKSMSSLKLSLRYVSVVSKRQSSNVKSDFFDFIHYTGTTSETTYKSYLVFKSYYDQRSIKNQRIVVSASDLTHTEHSIDRT